MTFEAERENRKAAAQRAVNDAVGVFMNTMTKIAVDFFVELEDVVYSTPDVYPLSTEAVFGLLSEEDKDVFFGFC